MGFIFSSFTFEASTFPEMGVLGVDPLSSVSIATTDAAGGGRRKEDIGGRRGSRRKEEGGKVKEKHEKE